MAALSRISVRVPECVAERFRALQYGEKQLVGTAALVWYFNADRESRRVYRNWARDIFEGYGTLDRPAGLGRAPGTARRRAGRAKRRSDA